MSSPKFRDDVIERKITRNFQYQFFLKKGSREASDESGQKVVGCAAARSLGMFAEAQGWRGEARGKFSRPVVLPDLQGKGPCGAEASTAESTFGSFGASKEQPLAANERANACV